MKKKITKLDSKLKKRDEKIEVLMRTTVSINDTEVPHSSTLDEMTFLENSLNDATQLIGNLRSNELIWSKDFEQKDDLIEKLSNEILTLKKSNGVYDLYDDRVSTLEATNAELVTKLKLMEDSLLEHDKLVKNLQARDEVLVEEVKVANEALKRLRSGKEKLDEILSVGKDSTDRRGLGYVDETTTPSTSRPVFIKQTPVKKNERKVVISKPLEIKEDSRSNGSVIQTHGVTLPVPRTHVEDRGTVRRPFIPTCHHCGKKGHIRPNCFLMKNEMSQKVTADLRSQTATSRGRVPHMHRHPPVHHFPPSTSFVPTCFHCGRIGHIRPKCHQLRDQTRPRYGDVRFDGSVRDGARFSTGGAHMDRLFRELQSIFQVASVGPSSSYKYRTRHIRTDRGRDNERVIQVASHAPLGHTPPVHQFRGQSMRQMRTPAPTKEWRPRSR